MRGKIAKVIRKMVYKEQSLKVRSQETVGRMVMNTGLRKVYRNAKKMFNLQNRRER